MNNKIIEFSTKYFFLLVEQKMLNTYNIQTLKIHDKNCPNI